MLFQQRADNIEIRPNRGTTRFPALVLLLERIYRRKDSSRTSWVIQFALVELAVVMAFLLRFDFIVPGAMRRPLLWAMIVWALTKMPVGIGFGLHLRLWRYFSIPDLRRLILSNCAGSLLVAFLVVTRCPYSFPRSVIVIDFLLSILFTAGAGAIARLAAESRPAHAASKQTRALIFGAGAAGVLLLRESLHNSGFAHQICGFVDDDESKRGRFIHGVPVLGAGRDLEGIVRQRQIGQVLIAIPSAQGPQMRRIIELCRAAKVTFRTMPAVSEIISNQGLGKQIRDVAVEDLLGRSAVRIDRQQIELKLENRAAMVTGAAGSIGSELCRQIAVCRPAALIMFDMAESALFHVERELRKNYPDLALYAEIGSAQNRQRLSEICSRYRPHIVYHAAAYKHVPMMEANVFEAVENNIAGTFNIASIAREYGVEDLVMISSDKAVRPTSVMGATKRISELVVRSLQHPGSRHVSVRFGNVLGSNGSVVPIFKDQISAGGPVTVTHPKMSRYFMTIPEAVHLVLQASVMGKSNEIFVLDMGAPIPIVDLARQLILLSGAKPDEDIRIEFTGMRPGEKLHEELNLADERMQPTHHPKINIFAGTSISQDRMAYHLSVLQSACSRRDLGALVEEMQRIVPDYNVSQEVLARIQASTPQEMPGMAEPGSLWEQSLNALAVQTLRDRGSSVLESAHLT